MCAVSPAALTMALTKEGGTTDGDTHTLNCTASKNLSLISPIKVEWISPNGSIVTGTEVNIAQSSVKSEGTTSLLLVFDPLSTSHGGRYVCKAVLETVALDEPLMQTRTANLRVQSK